jgi:hypothetical protein
MSTPHTSDLPPEHNPSRHPACHATSTASAATTGRPTSRTLTPRSASLLAAAGQTLADVAGGTAAPMA